MRILLAHPGTQHAPRLARELDQRDLLGEYWTGFALAEDALASRAIRRLAGRVVRGVNPRRLRTTPWIELRALAALKCGGDSHRVLHARNAAFQAAVPTASLAEADGAIGFDTSSWLLAERARQLGKPFWLERTIGHPAVFERLLAGLRRDFPAWAPPAAARPAEVIAAEKREHELAHRIVVGSDFARDTLRETGVPAERIRVNPYGVDWARFANAPQPSASAHPLRFLFAGSLQGRKGVPYLLEAWRRLAPRDAELWLAGSLGVDRALVPDLPGLKLLGQVPHADMPALLSQADVFVLPSLFEGFSLAVIEAVASGLALVVTPNTGAGRILAQPGLGRSVPAGDTDNLVEALHHYVLHPPDRRAVRAAASVLAPSLTWSAYGDRWATLLGES